MVKVRILRKKSQTCRKNPRSKEKPQGLSRSGGKYTRELGPQNK